jgi:ABC-type branched-subunit amino acid transport system permease subunit
MDVLSGARAVLILLSASVIAVAAALAMQRLVHRRLKRTDFVEHNEVAAIMIAVAGSLYGVVLGFLTVVAWQHYAEARELVVAESDADIDAWHMAAGLPSEAQKRVRSDVVTYANVMIDREWPLMRAGRFDENAAMVSLDAIDATATLVPTNAGEANAQRATLDQLNIVHDARQQRIAANGSGVSWFEWLVLATGAVCIAGFCCLFGVRSTRVHQVMTSIVVIVMVSILVLLFELQYPFRSDVGIGPGAWEDALAHIHEMQVGTMPNMKM